MEEDSKQGKKKIHDTYWYYTPTLKHNLLSVGQLCEKNYKIVFDAKQSII